MQRKTAIVIVIGATLLIIVGLLIFYFKFNTQPDSNLINGTNTGVFPRVTPGSGAGTQGGTGGTNEPSPGTGGGTTPIAVATLTKLSSVPISGAVIINSKDSPSKVRYVERSTGHIYEVVSENAVETRRVANTTIPKIYEALWKKTGDTVLFRYNKDGGDRVETFSATVNSRAGDLSEGELTGVFLTPNIKELTLSPDTEKIFYLLNNSKGSSGIVSKLDGTKKIEVFNSPLEQWQISWPKADTATLTSKPSVSFPGFMFFLNINTSRMDRIISDVYGLTTLVSPDAKNVLYNESGNGEVKLKLLDVTKNEKRALAIQTLPEKCVWSHIDSKTLYCAVPTLMPESDYPDKWYQGLVSFNDEIWKIDTQSKQTSFILSLRDSARENVDAVNLQLSEKEDFLIFTNKNNLLLWKLKFAPK